MVVGLLLTVIVIAVVGCIVNTCMRKNSGDDKVIELYSAQAAEVQKAATDAPQQADATAQKANPDEKKSPFHDPEGTVELINNDKELHTRFADLRKPVVAVVYAQWCGHCHHFAPIFVKACNIAANEGADCHYLAIDGGNAKQIHAIAKDRGVDIPGYPFVMIIKEDGQVITEQPSRTVEGVVEHILTNTGGPVRQSTKIALMAGEF